MPISVRAWAAHFAARTHVAWMGFFGVAVLGVFGPLVVYTKACFALECREAVAPFALGVTWVGVGISLLVAGIMLYVDGRDGGPWLGWAGIALIGVLVSTVLGWGAQHVTMDDRPVLSHESRDIKTVLDAMPGVERVGTEAGRTFATLVVLTADATAEQAEAVVAAFRNQVHRPDFDRWELDLEVRRGDTASSIKVGKSGLDAASPLVARWLALRDAFPEDEVTWTSRTWRYYEYGSSDSSKNADDGIGEIAVRLRPTAGADAVGAAYRKVRQEFPDLEAARWSIRTTAPRGAALVMLNRYPTEAELALWDRLHDNLLPPHALVLHSVEGITVQPHSDIRENGKVLAERHLPTIEQSGLRIRHTVADIRGDDPYFKYSTEYRLLQITAGACTARGNIPGLVERPLVLRYEKC
ncbi:hypothetical protein [Nocardia vulneris]|uniref:Uncharacterized protein n=1 Tax=Nocardia vulneris TaxID=1141657 RepID=A0ABR4ZI00_9NOCA|nr:hypothetical protein [Nocardia vulneris]KIA64712.1 hypothetical protein FG87_12625 [Nocardia vulneris]